MFDVELRNASKAVNGTQLFKKMDVSIHHSGNDRLLGFHSSDKKYIFVYYFDTAETNENLDIAFIFKLLRASDKKVIYKEIVLDADLKNKDIFTTIAKKALTQIPVESAREKIVVPKNVQKVAQKALDIRKSIPKSKRGGLDPKEAAKLGINSGVTRARRLANGNVTVEDLKRMKAFFARHSAYKKNHTVKDGVPSKSKMSWDLWGGNAAERWVNRVYDKYVATSNVSFDASVLRRLHLSF